jgi:hypothetical protein
MRSNFGADSEASKADFSFKPALVDRIVELTGGRMALLGKIAHAKNAEDVEEIMDGLVKSEKAYLLSRIGLIPDHDDDVMDEVRFSFIPSLLVLLWDMILVPDGTVHRRTLRFTAKMVILQLAPPPRVHQDVSRGRKVKSRAPGKWRDERRYW